MVSNKEYERNGNYVTVLLTDEDMRVLKGESTRLSRSVSYLLRRAWRMSQKQFQALPPLPEIET